MGVAENKRLVEQIFEELAQGNHRALLSRVAENSHWTITGNCPVSGEFRSRQEFYQKALKTINVKLTDRVFPTVLRILGEGDRVVVEWRGRSQARSGMAYDNAYCWVLQIRDGEIVEGTIYNDTALVTRLFEENP
jgi:ketosteroid isomerase-like protein